MDYEMAVRELWRCRGCVPANKKFAKREANLDYEMATRELTICWGKKKEKREATMEYEMAVRELRRKRGDVVTIFSESLPISIIQVLTIYICIHEHMYK